MAEGSDQDVEAVLDAVIISEPTRSSDGSEVDGEGRRQLNSSALSTVAVAIAFLFLE